MAIAEYSSGTNTMTTTEYSVAASGTPAAQTADGMYQLFLDVNAVAAGDEFVVKFYEKVKSAGTQRIVFQMTIKGVQSEPIFASPALLLINGWDMTVTKVAGTDRSMDFSIRQVS